MIKLVIFDLDDTLISEFEYIKSGYRAVVRELFKKYNLLENETYDRLMSLFSEDSKNVFNRLLDEYGISYEKADILKLLKVYREHMPEISFFDDVIPTVTMLKKQGIKLGIITDGYAVTQTNKLKAVGADKYFDEIIITDLLGKEFWKPHPKSFEIMKEKFKVDWDEMVYVGDNPEKDFYISKTYPIKTVRILRDNSVYKGHEYREGIKESIKIDKLLDLDKVI